MNTNARRAASAAFHAKRKAEGWRKVTVWIAPASQPTLARLVKLRGSNEKAIEAAISLASEFVG